MNIKHNLGQLRSPTTNNNADTEQNCIVFTRERAKLKKEKVVKTIHTLNNNDVDAACIYAGRDLSVSFFFRASW